MKETQSAGEHVLRRDSDFRLMLENVLEARQLIPTPLLSMLSQHATTEPASQEGEVVGLGRADAAIAMERTLRMVVNCMFVVDDVLMKG